MFVRIVFFYIFFREDSFFYLFVKIVVTGEDGFEDGDVCSCEDFYHVL